MSLTSSEVYIKSDADVIAAGVLNQRNAVCVDYKMCLEDKGDNLNLTPYIVS